MKMTEGNRGIFDSGIHNAGVQRNISIRKRTFYAHRSIGVGVIDTGFFNQHFIRNIGIIQLFLGVAFGIGMIRPERRIGLWAAATLWLIAHAVFHPVGSCRRHLLSIGNSP